jgi:hypothetical protein
MDAISLILKNMEIVKKNLKLVLFTLLSLIFSLGYVAFVTLHGGLDYQKNRTLLGGLGKMFGTAGFLALALVYARSFLKIIIREDAFWKRLLPIGEQETLVTKKFSVKLLILLNKTHAYLGVIAIIFIAMHCYLTGSYRDNFLLQAVLALMFVEGVTGLVMQLKYSPFELKQKSYLIHRQFIMGMMILIFAMFGHLILSD